jgi:hypothetical protein
MTDRKTPILITVGPLTGRIFAVTRYTMNADGSLIAHEKQDVTDQVGAALEELNLRGLELRPKAEAT